MDDALEELVIGEKKLDRKLVADILSPYVRLDRDTRNISPIEAWLGLGTDLKILVYLVARKAMMLLRFGLEAERATANEIASDTNLKLDAVNRLLRKMYAEGLLDRSKGRRYFVPDDVLDRVMERLRQQNI
jgi:DNA-binding transcriptional ArsR family regulator